MRRASRSERADGGPGAGAAVTAPGALVLRGRLSCRRCHRRLALARFARGGPPWRLGRSWWCSTCLPEVQAESARGEAPGQLALELVEPERDPAVLVFD